MFSVIIPARLNSVTLKNTLNMILNQTFSDFEVIVILDFETDNLIEHQKINYIFSGIKSPGEKRNLGIESSKGEYLAFLDDDAYPEISWLQNAKNLFDENPNYIGLCGPSITPNESNILEKIGGYIYESFLTSGPTRHRHLPLHHRFVEDHPSVNLFVKKEMAQGIGGFDTKFWPGEDTKFCLDLILKYKKKIYYSPLLIVFHFRRNVFHPHLIQLSRYASHRGFFAKKFPQTSFKVSYFVPTLFTLYLISIPLLLNVFPNIMLYYFLPLILYLIFLSFDIFLIYSKSSSLAISILSGLGIFLSNVTYGIFFIKGLLSKPELVLREVDILNEKYIKG
jgi:glycosyltransferase involved in cell wall biosynthesis